MTLEKIGGKSLTYRFDFSRDGEAIAAGRITCVFCEELPGHGLDTTIASESPHLDEWIARGW